MPARGAGPPPMSAAAYEQPAKVIPRRPDGRADGELRSGGPLDDRERARQFGAEFGLGALEGVTRSRNLPEYSAWAGLTLASSSLLSAGRWRPGWPGGRTPGGEDRRRRLGRRPLRGRLRATRLSASRGLRSATRLFRYAWAASSSWYHGEPEPRVARWADVRDFTVVLRPDGRGATAAQRLPGDHRHRDQPARPAPLPAQARSCAPWWPRPTGTWPPPDPRDDRGDGGLAWWSHSGGSR